jgi:hypothetical protein
LTISQTIKTKEWQLYAIAQIAAQRVAKNSPACGSIIGEIAILLFG